MNTAHNQDNIEYLITQDCDFFGKDYTISDKYDTIRLACYGLMLQVSQVSRDKAYKLSLDYLQVNTYIVSQLGKASGMALYQCLLAQVLALFSTYAFRDKQIEDCINLHLTGVSNRIVIRFNANKKLINIHTGTSTKKPKGTIKQSTNYL